MYATVCALQSVSWKHCSILQDGEIEDATIPTTFLFYWLSAVISQFSAPIDSAKVEL